MRYIKVTYILSEINATEVEVKFNQAVVTIKAGYADKMEATIELAGKLTKGDYTVKVTGLSEEALSKTVAVEAVFL